MLKDKKFNEVVDNLQEHLGFIFKALVDSGYKTIDQIENINGIYVFYEEDKPIYVGRTNRERMKKRIKEHSAKYSNQNSATFAYRLAKEIKKDHSVTHIDARDEDFIAAKERVFNMKVKIVEVNDPIIQTIAEPYLAHKLNTEKYNDFITH